MKFELVVSYLNELNEKIEFCNKFNFFSMKMDMDKKLFETKSVDIFNKKVSNLFEDDFSYNSVLNDNNIMIKNKDREIFNLLVNLCMKKGNKKLAYKNVKNTFCLLRKFYWLNASMLLRLILSQSESLFVIQKFSLGKKDKIIPRFIPFEKKTKYVLRMLVNYAQTTSKDYKYFYQSLANAIVEYSVPNNELTIKNKEDNQLAELNKFFLTKKKKNKRRLRLFRKINHWKE